jgi:hypothetical protein
VRHRRSLAAGQPVLAGGWRVSRGG